jgi:hypothetical protein
MEAMNEVALEHMGIAEKIIGIVKEEKRKII